MDLKGMKDQFSEKAKNELLEKIEEVKQDISQKFEDSSEGPASARQPSSSLEADAEKGDIAVPATTESAETEESIDQADTVQVEGSDVDSSEDEDKRKEEAA